MKGAAAFVCAAVLAVASIAAGASAQGTPGPAPRTDAVLARGRFLVVYGNCNECHSPGWRASDGTMPQAQWLTGSRIGFRGDWGTSYPANLRLEFQALDEDAWSQAVRTRGGHPPMTWHDLRVLSAADRHAIYAFIRNLGPAGVPAPAAVPPWREPATPYIETRPHDPKSPGPR